MLIARYVDDSFELGSATIFADVKRKVGYGRVIGNRNEIGLL